MPTVWHLSRCIVVGEQQARLGSISTLFSVSDEVLQELLAAADAPEGSAPATDLDDADDGADDSASITEDEAIETNSFFPVLPTGLVPDSLPLSSPYERDATRSAIDRTGRRFCPRRRERTPGLRNATTMSGVKRDERPLQVGQNRRLVSIGPRVLCL